MDAYEAVMSRRAVRGFTNQHVPREVLERVLSAAAWSPSGSNLQPWNSYVLTGARLAERPHAPGAARRDGHVRRGSSGRQRPSACQWS
jgi:nitroreductase